MKNSFKIISNSLQDNNINEALDVIYSEIRIKILYNNEDYSLCNYIFDNIDIDSFNKDVLVCLLVATLDLKDKLSSRSGFYFSVKTKLELEFPNEVTEMLFGLE
jgi:hypothetical protein